MNELIQLSRSGDPNAFKELLSIHKDKVYHFAYRILRNKQECEDVVQETFIRIYLNLHRFDEKKSFTTWMFEICKNVCYDILRREKVRKKLSLDAVNPELTDHNSFLDILPDREKLPIDQVIDKETSDQVHTIINHLPDQYKELVYQRYILEMSLEEMSEQDSIPINTVKTRLFRARQFIKKRWGSVFLRANLLMLSMI